MIALARILIPGVLVGVAISLIANIVIGGIFYNLFNDTAKGALAGTVAASVVGAILGVIAISTANRKGSAVVLRAAAAGALIGMAGGFFGSIDPEALDGFIESSILLGIAIGVMFGAAGLRGTGMRFASAWVDEDEELGTFGKALDGSFAGMLIGISCALPVVMFYGGILVQMRFRPRVDFVRLVSTDGLLLGAILGITAGILIGLVLSRKRVDGLLNGALVGAMVGVALALPGIMITTFTILEDFSRSFVPFARILLAIIGGAVLGAAMPDARFASRYSSMLIGAGVGVVLALPSIIYAGLLAIYVGNPPDSSFWDNFIAWNRGNSLLLVTSVVAGAVVCFVTAQIVIRNFGTSFNYCIIPVSMIVAAISMQSNSLLYMLNIYSFRQGIVLPSILFNEHIISALLRLIISVSFGTLIGLAVSAVWKLAVGRSNPDKILSG